MKKAVVLLSGGLDSSTTLAYAKKKGYEIHALSFDYGQRHRKELSAARKIAMHFKVSHRVIKIDLRQIGGSALTDDVKVPVGESPEQIKAGGIPSTYVPARNTVFLSYALAFAEIVGADAIFIGANAVDYSGYPDCRPEYYEAFKNMARLATKRGVEGKPVDIKYPLISMSKAGIIKLGKRLRVPYKLTWSCYKGGAKACGICHSCVLRLKGFKEAGVKDPVKYAIA